MRGRNRPLRREPSVLERWWFLPFLWIVSGIANGALLGLLHDSPGKGALFGLGVGLVCAGITEAILRWPRKSR